MRKKTSAIAVAVALTATVGIGGKAALASSSGPVQPQAVAVSTGAYYYEYPVIPGTSTSDLATASTVFTIPTITCAAGSGEGESFGLTGSGISSNSYLAVAETYCTGTTPTYKFYVQSAGAMFTEPGANPGDLVVASFLQTTAYQQATIHDLTDNTTWVADSSNGPVIGYASEGVSLFPLGLTSVAPFTKTKFSSNEVNGDYIGFQSPTVTKWYRSGTELASTSTLSSENAFTVTFHHS
jgi:hypothetical protein